MSDHQRTAENRYFDLGFDPNDPYSKASADWLNARGGDAPADKGGAMTDTDDHSGAHLLRHIFNATMPLDGRLRMLNAYFNRADSADDLYHRRARIADAGIPQREVERLYHPHREVFVQREA